MNYDPYEYRSGEGSYPLGLYLSNVFLWMCLGLMITFGVAIGCWMTGLSIVVLAGVGPLLLLVGQLVAVLALSAFVEKLSVGAAKGWFVAYSVLSGVTLSVYLYIYELGSLVFVFLLTAVFFGALGLYGHRTKSDLSGLRPYLICGLVILLVFVMLSLFVPLGGLDTVMTLGGVVLFLAFTAYDVQNCQRFYFVYQHDPEMLEKAAIYSALELYLDFINLFLHLLRYLGKRRD